MKSTDKTGDAIPPVSRTTLAIEIVAQFIELIHSDNLAPEERLPTDRKLPRKLGVGRTSLREAVQASRRPLLRHG